MLIMMSVKCRISFYRQYTDFSVTTVLIVSVFPVLSVVAHWMATQKQHTTLYSCHGPTTQSQFIVGSGHKKIFIAKHDGD